MDRRKALTVALTTAGVTAVAGVALAANLGVLGAADEDPTPVGGLNVANVGDLAGSTTTSVFVPDPTGQTPGTIIVYEDGPMDPTTPPSSSAPDDSASVSRSPGSADDDHADGAEHDDDGHENEEHEYEGADDDD